ncbi:MAG: DUF3365 domain-containing protein [Acidobacteria bacterium]|nr:DUF3365 domain-containing protein [Acidobacteriota bacterium]
MYQTGTAPKRHGGSPQQRGVVGASGLGFRGLWLIAAAWTFLLAISCWWNIAHIDKTVHELARAGAVANFENDLLYRQWATIHGGVYVPTTDKTPPNPYLKGTPERDITTPSGKRLTLMNPAYMTRQVHELGRSLYGHQGHITSLRPIRPENRPDDWERRALEAFERGAEEYSSIEPLDGQPHLRLMRPVKATAGCLKCHAAQGYKEGQIRGGISVSVPMSNYQAIVRPHESAELLAHAGLWGLGMALLYGGGRSYLRRRLERDQAQAELEAEKIRFRSLFEDSPVAIWEEDFSAVRRRLNELRASGVTDLRAYFDQNPGEVAHLADLVCVVEINRASVELFGARSKEELVLELRRYFGAESLTVFASEVLALGEGQTHFKAEAPRRNSKGEPVVFELSLAVQPGHEETLSSVLVSFVDITERKRAAAALSHSEYLLSQSQSVARVGHYVFDLEAGTWSSSSVLDELLGIGPEYPKTVQGWLDLMHPDERRTMEEYLNNRVLRGGKRFDKEYRIIRPSDGETRWMHGLGSSFEEPGGSRTQVFGTI